MSGSYTLPLQVQLPMWDLSPIFPDQLPGSISDYQGKPLVILIFSIKCPGCLGRAIPFANRLVYEMGEELQVLGIHTTFEGKAPELEELQAAKEEYHIRFPIFQDRHLNSTFTLYKAGGTPHWLVLDRSGKLQYSIFGSDPNNALLRIEYKLQELLHNPEAESEELRKVTVEEYSLDPDRYELREGSANGAPSCPYGNQLEWIGYDLRELEFVRFTKGVFKKIIKQKK